MQSLADGTSCELDVVPDTGQSNLNTIVIVEKRGVCRSKDQTVEGMAY